MYYYVASSKLGSVFFVLLYIAFENPYVYVISSREKIAIRISTMAGWLARWMNVFLSLSHSSRLHFNACYVVVFVIQCLFFILFFSNWVHA